MVDWLLHDRVGEAYVAVGIVVAGAIVAYAFGRGLGAFSKPVQRGGSAPRRLRP
jgi:hypothetical protein